MRAKENRTSDLSLGEDSGGMSVSKARRILGSYANQFSDDQVKEIISTLRMIAREQLLYNGSKYEESSNSRAQYSDN